MNSDDKMMGMLAHLLGLFTGFLGPLIIYLVITPNQEFAKDQAREALNFQITIIVAMIVSGVLALVMIGFLFMVAIGILDIVLCIMAAMAANRGERYRYPINIRFVR